MCFKKYFNPILYSYELPYGTKFNLSIFKPQKEGHKKQYSSPINDTNLNASTQLCGPLCIYSITNENDALF